MQGMIVLTLQHHLNLLSFHFSVVLPDHGQLPGRLPQGDAEMGVRDPLLVPHPRRAHQDTRRAGVRRQRH